MHVVLFKESLMPFSKKAPWLALVLCFGVGTLSAKVDSVTIQKDLRSYWDRQWPHIKLVQARVLDSTCQAGQIKNKGIPQKTCLFRVDVYTRQGHRYLIFRKTEVHYQATRLVSVHLGELEKAWPQEGVPAPTPEQIRALFPNDLSMRIKEIGTPRPCHNAYRVTVLLVSTTEEKKSDTFLDLQSDGLTWRVVSAKQDPD
jgi:hypothetical protein